MGLSPLDRHPAQPARSRSSLELGVGAGAAAAGVDDASAADNDGRGGPGTWTSSELARDPLCAENDDGDGSSCSSDREDHGEDELNNNAADHVDVIVDNDDGYREVELVIDLQRKDPLGQRYGGPWRLVAKPTMSHTTPEVAAPAEEAMPTVSPGVSHEGWNPFGAVADDFGTRNTSLAPALDLQLDQLLRDLDSLIEIGRGTVHFAQARTNGLRRLVISPGGGR